MIMPEIKWWLCLCKISKWRELNKIRSNSCSITVFTTHLFIFRILYVLISFWTIFTQISKILDGFRLRQSFWSEFFTHQSFEMHFFCLIIRIVSTGRRQKKNTNLLVIQLGNGLSGCQMLIKSCETYCVRPICASIIFRSMNFSPTSKFAWFIIFLAYYFQFFRRFPF